ncbi:MAG TPA: anaerobic ribonucleoside-triphosphate reductase activating protein [Bacillota bacterium]|jgi:pyruvate formate lyase activating enzyme|nr:anaerobic ribonucleoside-triphosphate reductase activating protein [Bacillota bacterium]
MKIAGIIKSSLIDYPEKASTVIFLGGCNFRCGYCHNPELLHFQDETTQDDAISASGEGINIENLLSFLRSRKRFIDAVCISGGEPTLNRELPLLIGRIKALGLAVKLDTNGSNPKMLTDLLKNGLVDYVAMDIKAPADKYEQVIRNPADLKAIKASAQLLKDAHSQEGFACEFRTTVCKELLSERDIERMLKEYPEAPPWYLQRFHNPGNILDNEGQYSAYPAEEMERLGKRLCVSVR